MPGKSAAELAELRKKRTFKKFTYHGIDVDKLVGNPHANPPVPGITHAELANMVRARIRRRMTRGLKRKPMALIKKLRAAKAAAHDKDPSGATKPEGIKTHLRNMIIVPEMIGSVVGVYNGKVFNQVEVKPDMVGCYLGEFSITYKPVGHGRPGIGATNSSRFIPLS